MKMKLEGLNKLNGIVTRFGNRMNKKLNTEIEKSAIRISNNAKAKLSKFGTEDDELARNIDAVRGSIGYSVDKANYEAEVHSGGVQPDNMAAYLEFGTGKYASRYTPSLRPQFRVLASSFFVNGRGTLTTHAHLIPSYEKEKEKLTNRLVGMKVGW